MIFYMNCLDVYTITTEAACQRCSYEKQIQNIKHLIREQQRLKKVSIKLQSNFTETTHQHGHSPINSNSVD